MPLPHGDGPIPGKIMIVGEAWGAEEERTLKPFVGASGQELNRMLQEAGILRSECYVSNVVNARPPQNDIGAWVALKKKDITTKHIPLRDKLVLPIVKEGYDQLLREIDLVQPNVIVACGNLALWALSGQWGVTKWRGSELRLDAMFKDQGETERPKVIPTIHPAVVLREWAFRPTVVNDLKRVRRHSYSREYNHPDWKFILRPSYSTVMQTLCLLESRAAHAGEEPLWLDFDLETRAGHIACAGISWSRTEALCIPFMCVERRAGYWEEEEELHIIWHLCRLLRHPNVRVRGQNLLYDCQYTMRHWHFTPRVAQDTMISHHTAFAGLRKALDFQASMYCESYRYWKDDGKNWEPGVGENQLWAYNCVDCVRTREVGEVEQAMIPQMGLTEVEAFQQRKFWPVLYAMVRGVRVNMDTRAKLAGEVQDELANREGFLQELLGHTINPRSSPQMCKLFYEDLKQQPIMTRPKKGVPGHLTCDDEALQLIATREPLLKPITNAIADIRTLGIFLNNFILAGLDVDGRLRCSFNICGTATYRLASSKNAFGGGCNLQTVPSDKSKSVGKAKARGVGEFSLPNLRTMIVPDPGYTFFDLDLDRADLQVVVWEADDEMLKAALRLGADIHLLNVYTMDRKDPPPLEELVESHPRYADHRGPRKHKREFAKVFCYATNYGGSARTVAAHTGRSIHEIDQAQKYWFGAHPGIKKWHERVQQQINSHRFVENRFGYRWYIFDRLDTILPEAVAWIPQSTVGNVIDRIWMNFFDNIPEVETLLQVHDSLAGQFPTATTSATVAKMHKLSRVVVPYEDPLVIPVGIQLSDKSWGDCA